MSTIETLYGEVSLDKLVYIYEQHMRHQENNTLRTKAYLQTEEGKHWMRDKSKAYYEKNKEACRAKARERMREKYALKKSKCDGLGHECDG